MRRKIWKLSFVALLVQFALSAPAYACQGPQFESTVFLPSMPEVGADTDFAGSVILHQKRKWFFFKPAENKEFSAEIVQSPTHPDLVGSILDLPFSLPTSCGPWLSDGDRGFVTATLLDADDGLPTLVLTAHRNMDIWDGLKAEPDASPEQE